MVLKKVARKVLPLFLLSSVVIISFVGEAAYSQAEGVSNQSKAGEVKSVELVNESQKTSYSVGAKYGEGLKKDLGDLDLSAFISGLSDAFTAKPLRLSADEISKTITVYQQKKIQEVKEKQQSASRQNKEKGTKFLEENKKKKDLVVTASGLQYHIIKDGAGAIPSLNSTVKVHYRGTLIDGTVFDSSIDRGEPVSFPVNGVIKGWTEALQLMKVGSKWQLFIPSELAYGEQGAGGAIGPHETLIFEVELLSVES